MASEFNNGGIAPINRSKFVDDAQYGVPLDGINKNYYDNSQVKAASEPKRIYEQNWDPGSFSFMTKTSPASVGLNPFQNNFSEVILAYKDDGTMDVGHTIGIA